MTGIVEMLEGTEPHYVQQGKRLANALRQLRLAAGLSTYELATLLRRLHPTQPWSQPKVSKIEHNRTPATAVDVQAWSDAVNAALQQTIQRVQQAQADLADAIPWPHPVVIPPRFDHRPQGLGGTPPPDTEAAAAASTTPAPSASGAEEKD